MKITDKNWSNLIFFFYIVSLKDYNMNVHFLSISKEIWLMGHDSRLKMYIQFHHLTKMLIFILSYLSLLSSYLSIEFSFIEDKTLIAETS